MCYGLCQIWQSLFREAKAPYHLIALTHTFQDLNDQTPHKGGAIQTPTTPPRFSVRGTHISQWSKAHRFDMVSQVSG